MKVEAHAKINLTLDIGRKRPDGYHELSMIMQSVKLSDIVSIALSDAPEITVKSSLDLHCPIEKNIAFKAAKAFFEYSGISSGADIEIEKRIPMQAGMAGGSADGAAVLVALNRLCGTEYSAEELCKIGAAVGADIPFCIAGGTMLAEGKGERLTRLRGLCEFAAPPAILICKPDIGVSTAKAYADADSFNGEIIHPNNDGMISAIANGDVRGVADNLCNVFEQVLQIGECDKIKSAMVSRGALGACMTGSGTAVFGLFDDKSAAKSCGDGLASEYGAVFVTEASDCGCKIICENPL